MTKELPANAVSAGQSVSTAGKEKEAIWQQAFDDLHWATNNDELQKQYNGEFIVVHRREVLAHGFDRRQALRDAMSAGYSREELVVVPMLRPEAEVLPDSAV